MRPSEPLIVVGGPTAAGKSAAAIEIARRFDAEIVSADAFQVYRGLDIGTGKVDAASRATVAHHCLDIVDPDEPYTAGEYALDAAAAIAEIAGKGRRIVVAGGSGFYIRALVDGLAPLPGHDPQWRAGLEKLEARRGAPYLFAILEALDPEWARSVGPTDRQRILRGVEVTLRLGVPMSSVLAREPTGGPRFDALWVAIDRPREALNRRIGGRVDEMLAAGWLDEVAALRAAGYGAAAPGMRAIGYGPLLDCLAGKTDLGAVREEIVRATRRYAKRQMTWFRRQAPCTWFRHESTDEASRLALHERICSHLAEKLSC